MQILYYHRKKHSEQEKQILDRASHKKHLLKKTILWDILLFCVLGILGPVMHYFEPMLIQIPIFKGIFPINESIWEHLKLLFYPAAAVGIVRRLVCGKLQHGILTTFAEGIVIAMLLMVAGFYTYSGILGMHSLPMDISLFYLCSLVMTVYVSKQALRQKNSSLSGLLVLLLLTGCFLFFSYNAPDIGLFRDLSQPLR